MCYNALEALRHTAYSVRGQRGADFEYIIVDGGSNDGTQTWLQAHADVADQVLSERDKGIYDAMNKGAALAMGEWVLFLNAGDTFHSADTLAEITPMLRIADEHTALVYGDITRLRHGRTIVKIAEEPHNAHRMFFCHQALFTRTHLLRNMPYDIAHPFSADFKFVKMAYKRGVGMLHAPVVIANFDTGGVSSTRVNDGLKDNISVIRETDSWFNRLRFIPRLWARIIWNIIRCR